MPIDVEDIDGEVEALYRETGHTLREPPGALALVEAHPELTIEWCADLLQRSSLRENDDGTATMRLPAGLPLAQTNWKAGHELWEYRLGPRKRRLPYVGHDRERVVNQLTAATLAPAPALREAYEAVGLDLGLLGRLFCVSQVVVANRLGEVLGMPVALCGRFVTRRGPNVLPGNNELARLIARGGDEVHRVVWLTDATRCALVTLWKW